MRIHVVLFALAACATTSEGPRTYQAEGQVRDAIDATNEAARHHQTDAVLAMLDPGFVLIDHGATYPRDTKVVGMMPVDRRIIKMDHVTASQAIVISKSGTQRYAEVWVRRDGQWKLSRFEDVSGS